MKINLKKLTKKDTLRHRDTAQMILKHIQEAPKNQPVTLDFHGIIFSSKPFLHELLSGLLDREIHYTNTNEEIDSMIKLAFIKPKLKLKTDPKIRKLSTLILS